MIWSMSRTLLTIPLGGYKYQRKYRFSNGSAFSSFHNISFDKETGLNGCFTTRDFPEQAFAGEKWAVQDLVETFIPSGPGVIKSVMAVEWKGKARNLSAIVESEYYLNHNLVLPGLHWRHVAFVTEKSVPGVYIQSEKITVHRDLKEVGGNPINMLITSTERRTSTQIEGGEKVRQEVELMKRARSAVAGK